MLVDYLQKCFKTRTNITSWCVCCFRQVRFSAFKVVNVLAVCSMPFAVRLIDFTKNNRPIAR